MKSFLRYRSLLYLASLGLLGGPFWALLGPFGGPLGDLWEPFWALVGRLGALLGRLGAS